MKYQLAIIVAAIFLSFSLSPAQTTATQSSTCSAPATTTAPAVSAEVMKILKDLESAGEKHTTIRADLTMDVADRMTGDSERRTGWIVYRKVSEKQPTGLRVHFETLKQGDGPVTRQRIDHAFDGHFWTVKRHAIKNMARYQIVAEGEQAEPVRLGKGRLPLPFGQKADDVLEYYDVQTRPVAPDEPEGSIYLKLTAHRKRYKEVDYPRVEMWIDAETHLPIKVISRDKKKKKISLVFAKLETDVEVDAKKMFHMPNPPGDWTYSVERLDK